MKLTRPLSEPERQRVDAALAALKTTHAAFEAKLAAFAASTATRGALQTRLATARRTAAIASSTGGNVDGLRDELAAQDGHCATAQREMESARLRVVAAIQEAGKIIHKTAAPLLEQFRQSLVEALRPFSTDPEAVATSIQDAHTEFPALLRFLQTGHHVTKTAPPQDIAWLVYALGNTLQAIVSGADIWKLRGETASV